jgi:hypothetical protein
VSETAALPLPGLDGPGLAADSPEVDLAHAAAATPAGKLTEALEAALPGASPLELRVAYLACGEYAAALVEQHARRPGKVQG